MRNTDQEVAGRASLARAVIAARRAILALCLAAGCCLLGSCSATLFGPPPIHYEALSAVLGDRGSLHSVAGLYYTIANAGDREIIGLEIGFSLFDENGMPVPLFGANSFVVQVTLQLAAGERGTLCTKLDRYLPIHTASIAVGRFRVITATFADGSLWRNPGSYVYTGVSQ